MSALSDVEPLRVSRSKAWALFERLKGVKFPNLEALADGDVDGFVVPIRECLEECRMLLADVERFARTFVASSAEQTRAIEDIRATSYAGRLMLRQSLMELVPGSVEAWERLAAADSGRRGFLRIVGSLLPSMDALFGDPSTPNLLRDETETALLIRRAYTIFRNDVLGSTAPDIRTIRNRMRHTGATLSKLTGRSIFSSFRIYDQRLLVTLKQRVHGWLAGESHDLVVGMRIWEEVVVVATCMSEINHRAELREYDRDACERVLHVLRQAPPKQAEEVQLEHAELMTALQPLFGRDPELDAVIEGRREPTRSELAGLLTGILQALGSKAPTG